VLEYITREVLEGAGIQCKASKNNKKSNLIKPHHISLAFRTDEELNKLVGDRTVVPMGGVIPFIHPYIKHSNRKKKQARISQTQKTQISQQVEESKHVEDAEEAKVE
jgi:histone H2A